MSLHDTGAAANMWQLQDTPSLAPSFSSPRINRAGLLGHRPRRRNGGRLRLVCRFLPSASPDAPSPMPSGRDFVAADAPIICLADTASASLRLVVFLSQRSTGS